MNTYGNPVLEQMPLHLKQYVVEQDYARYTSIDQAIWRYVMRQNYSYLKDVAYYPYIPGLKKAGLTIERIPDLQHMNDNLKEIGWGAVTVDGFIPPLAFMEFQAHQVLVIAADIRQLDHIEYTPAPDIIHESSGHAPIIAEPEYAAYLQYFGTVGTKAMFSAKDFELYEAIRHLSILKEKNDVDPLELEDAQKQLDFLQNNMGAPSEMALLSRLHWWTVEYGLIGTLENPKIYGAGLLSSIGESASCMNSAVKKIPYTLQAVNYPYDITKTQPQLFVTPDFDTLLNVLEEFSDTMAFRKGGTESINKAIECRNVCTAVYSSGLQITGIFIHPDTDDAYYLQTKGPSALSFRDLQLLGHGKEAHQKGFSSPIGRLKGAKKALENYSKDEFISAGIEVGKNASLLFESGIEVRGKVQSLLSLNQKNLLISFEDCKVTDTNTLKILFHPDWGIYDLAIGEKIQSVFSGAADKEAYQQVSILGKKSHVAIPYSEKERALQQVYAEVRKIRTHQTPLANAPILWTALKEHHKNDWLCALDLLEILDHEQSHHDLALEITGYLKELCSRRPSLKKLIEDGLKLIEQPEIKLINE